MSKTFHKSFVFLFAAIFAMCGFFIASDVLAARTLNSVTINGVSSVFVKGGQAVTIAVTVTLSGTSSNSWYSTRYQIGTLGWVCVDTPDHLSGHNGTYTETFSITAPVAQGNYNLAITAHGRDNTCNTSYSTNQITLTNGIIVDNTAPTLNLPADIIQQATGITGKIIDYTATANDSYPAHPAVNCTPPSGSVFPIGLTTVNCSATDNAGNISNGSFKVEITKLDQTISVTKSAPVSAIYGDNFDVSASATSGLDVVITTSGSCFGDGTNSATITMTSGAGTCAVHYNQAGDPSYNPAPEVIENTTAQPKIINVTADAKGKNYGDAGSALTYVNDPLVGSDSFTGDLSRDPGEDVGVYAITQGTLALSGNYTLNYVPANLTISQFIPVINVIIEAKNKTYGDADPALTYTFSPALYDGDTFSGSLSRASGEDVGFYVIAQGTLTAGPNYNLSFAGADLTINQKDITTTADVKNKTYGDADPAFTYQITSGSLVGSDAFSGDLTRNAGEDVGIYAITQGTLSAGPNYNLSFAGADLIINQKDITVTANPKNKIYNDADPALTYTSDPLAFGDSFTGALIRDDGESVGSYAINQGTLSAGTNYNITFVPSIFTIMPLTGGSGGNGYNKPSEIKTNDFDMLIADWGKNGSSAEDLNHDGVVDEYDLALLMSNWSL
ncbi:MAG: MBG domain-containing protein [Candidatus Staskawiczbacteria bacterium]|nr:MBG domain-containing protein [Candidatus Staskawiczbacteria bacterium]